MTCSIRRTDLLALALLIAPGCVTGHLLDAARTRETVAAFRAARLDGDRLVVGYRAAVTDDAGKPRGECERWAAVSLADLQRHVPLESLRVERLEGDEAAGRGGRAVPFQVDVADDRPVTLVLSPDATGSGDVRLPSGALTRVRVAPWVYPLLPLTLTIDAVGDPPLFLFAPAIIVVGD